MSPYRILEREVLRWNRSFSLVSRQDPEGRTRRLIQECRLGAEALAAVLDDLGATGPLLYADLGTGGGFPGLVWALDLPQLLPAAIPLRGAHLVEPRAKRAWFLRQTAGALGLDGVRVHGCRWGETSPLSPEPAALLVVSMKALHLPETDVLAHAHAAFPGWRGPVAVVRFTTEADARTGSWDPGLGIPATLRAPSTQPHHRFAMLQDPDLHASLLISWHPSVAG